MDDATLQKYMAGLQNHDKQMAQVKIDQENAQKVQQQATQKQVKAPNIIDTLQNKLVSPPLTPFNTQNTQQVMSDMQKRSQYPTTHESNTLNSIISPIAAGLGSAADTATLGALPMVLSKVAPNIQNMRNINQSENPISSTIGGLAGYAVPGSIIGKGVKAGATALTNIPKIASAISKILPATDAIGKVARVGLTGAVEGGIMGGIQGTNEGIQNNQSIPDIAKNSLSQASQFGALGLGLGGGLSGIGKIASKAKSLYTDSAGMVTNRGLQSINDAMAEYKNKGLTNVSQVSIKSQSPSAQNYINKQQAMPVASKNISDFTPQNKTVKPIQQYSNTINNYNPNRIQPQNYNRETPFKVTPGEIATANKPPQVQSQYAKESFNQSTKINEMQTNNKSLNAPNKALNNQSNINSPSEIKTAPTQSVNKLTAEQHAKITVIDEKIKENRDFYNKQVSSGQMSAEDASKRIKGFAMENSAIKRQIIQGNSFDTVEGGLTANELSKKIKTENTNYIGKKVTTPYGEGIVTKSSFGKVGVKLDSDGSFKYYKPDQVKATNPIQRTKTIDSVNSVNQTYTAVNRARPIESNLNNTVSGKEPTKTIPSTEQPIVKNEPPKITTEVPKSPINNKTSEFGTNTYKRTTEISQEVKDATPESTFGYASESDATTKARALANVQNDFQGTMQKLINKETHNATDIHESAIIAKQLEKESIKSPEKMSEYLNFLDKGAKKGASEAGKSLHAVDVAWEKEPTPTKAIIAAQDAVKKAELYVNKKVITHIDNETLVYNKAIKEVNNIISKKTAYEVIAQLKNKFGNLCD